MWVLMFLLTPVLAGPIWRVALVLALVLITAVSGLPARLWWRSLLLVVLLGCGIGLLAMLLPTGEPGASLNLRPTDEVPGLLLASPSWELVRLGPLQLGSFELGPLVVDRRSAELGLNSATLIVTVVHSVNLMLLSTPSEELMWALSWWLTPLARLGVPLTDSVFSCCLRCVFSPGAGGASEPSAFPGQSGRESAPTWLQDLVWTCAVGG